MMKHVAGYPWLMKDRRGRPVVYCGVCGRLMDDFYECVGIDFHEVKEIYQVGYVHVCSKCVDKINSFVDYYGYKKPKDLRRLHAYMIRGIKPMADYSALMNGGYYE